MKFKVHAHKVEHVADIEVEAPNKVEASMKVIDMLDTQNGVYILVVESETPGPVVGCMGCKDIVQMINETAARSEDRSTPKVQFRGL